MVELLNFSHIVMPMCESAYLWCHTELPVTIVPNPKALLEVSLAKVQTMMRVLSLCLLQRLLYSKPAPLFNVIFQCIQGRAQHDRAGVASYIGCK